RTRSDAVDARLGPRRGGVDRRTAGLAERLLALRAAVGGLGVHARVTRDELERAWCGADVDAERRARQHLAVPAMTDPRRRRIDVGLVSDRTAVASASDMHARGVACAGAL